MTALQTPTETTLSTVLDTLFNDRHRIRGIRIDGHNNHLFTFKVYHERRGSDPRRNVRIEPTTDFELGLEYAVREGFSRSAEVELTAEIIRDIHLAGIRKYVAQGNTAVLRPCSPSISIPSVNLYKGHETRQNALFIVGAPTISAAIHSANIGTINTTIDAQEPYESRSLLIQTGEFPAQR